MTGSSLSVTAQRVALRPSDKLAALNFPTESSKIVDLAPGLASLKDKELPKELIVALSKITFGPTLDIPIANVKPYKGQPREHFDQEELQGLAESMRLLGQLQPGMVRQISKDSYEIIDGERRWRSAQLAGKEVFRAQLIEGPAKIIEEIKFLLSLVSNFGRVGHTTWELARSFLHLRQKKYSVTAIAKISGNLAPFVDRHLRIAEKLHPKLQELYKKPERGAAPSVGIGVTLTKLPKTHQLHAYSMIRGAGGGISTAEKVVTEILEKISGQKKEKQERKGTGRKAADLPEITLTEEDTREILKSRASLSGLPEPSPAPVVAHDPALARNILANDKHFREHVDPSEIDPRNKSFRGLREKLRELSKDRELGNISDAGRLMLATLEVWADLFHKFKVNPFLYKKTTPAEVIFTQSCINDFVKMVATLTKIFPDVTSSIYEFDDEAWQRLASDEESDQLPEGVAPKKQD